MIRATLIASIIATPLLATTPKSFDELETPTEDSCVAWGTLAERIQQLNQQSLPIESDEEITALIMSLPADDDTLSILWYIVGQSLKIQLQNGGKMSAAVATAFGSRIIEECITSKQPQEPRVTKPQDSPRPLKPEEMDI